MSDRFTQVAGRAAGLAATLLALALAGLVMGGLVAPRGRTGVLQPLDNWMRGVVLAHRTPLMMELSRPFGVFGHQEVLVLLALMLTVGLAAAGMGPRSWAPLIAWAGNGLLVGWLKVTVGRPPPSPNAHVFHAFPSGHTSGVTAVFLTAALVVTAARRVWWPVVAAAALMLATGAAMIILNGHWLTDVVAALLLAGIWSVGVFLALPAPADEREAEARRVEAPRRPPWPGEPYGPPSPPYRQLPRSGPSDSPPHPVTPGQRTLPPEPAPPPTGEDVPAPH